MTLFPRLNWVIILSVMAIAVCPLQAIAEIPSTKIDSIQKVLAESATAEVANPNQPINEISPSSETPVEKDSPSQDICPLSVDWTKKADPIPLAQLTVDDQTITLQIQGTTVLDQSMLLNDPKISEILKQNQEKKLTKAEFIPIYQEIAKSLTQIYLNQGYITSKAVPQENLEIPVDGVVTIPILEGRLKEILLIGRGRLNPNYLCDRVGLAIGVPLNIIRVEEQLRLLKQNPLLSVGLIHSPV